MDKNAPSLPLGPILNLYPDSLGGTLSNVADFLELPQLEEAFSYVYILPSLFNSDLDRGFSLIDYSLNEMLASQEDLERIRAKNIQLIVDFVINHASVLSKQFQDILRNGKASKYRDFFIDWNKFWSGHGTLTDEGYVLPNPSALESMFFRKPGLPLMMVRMPDGSSVPYWNTFYQEITYPEVKAHDLVRALDMQYGSALQLAGIINQALKGGSRPEDIDFGRFENHRQSIINLLQASCRYLGQMDLNIHSPLVWEHYRDTLKKLAAYGAAIVRLDAFAYASKEPGARNFLNDPGTWDLLQDIRAMADEDALSLLPEIHASYSDHICDTLSAKGYLCYDFFLPGLILDAVEQKSGEYLIPWALKLYQQKILSINMLGCHDGIPLLDLKGLLPEDRIQGLIDLVVARGGMVKNLHGQKEVYYQVNATYFSALGSCERKLLLSRALQLFMPGIPQIWYLDLFGGENDVDAVTRAGSSGHKEINRTNLSRQQISLGLKKSLVKDQLSLIRFRNTFAAFSQGAAFQAQESQPGLIQLSWQLDGHIARLDADLHTGAFAVKGNGPQGEPCFFYAQT